MSAAVAPREFAAPSTERLVRVELRKMVDTRSGRWLLIVVGLITLAVAVLVAIFGNASDVNFNQMLEDCWLPLAILLPILGILAATGEWSQRTALVTFALVPQRERIVKAKLLAAAVLGGWALVASVIAAAIGTSIGGGSYDLNVSHLTEGLLLLELNILVGLGFGLALMSPALAIVASFVLPTAFAGIGALSKSLDSTWDWLDPARTQDPLSSAAMHGDDWGKLGTSTLMWLVVPTVVGLYRTLRREAK